MASASVNPLGQSSLAKRLGWTFLLLCCYRIGVHVPIPGVDAAALAAYFKSLSGTLFDMFDMFSGGGLSNVSVFALGVMPYISASIIMQLLQVVSPDIKRMAKEEGQAGRRKITQYTRYLTVLITLVQGLFISIGLESMTSPDGTPIVLNAGWHFRMVTMATFTAGSMLVMWLGEQITERGIGNGISIILFAGIVARLPVTMGQIWSYFSAAMQSPESYGKYFVFAPLFIILFLAVIWVIVFMNDSERRIPVQYAKKVVGRKVYGGQSTFLPIKVTMSGVMPVIFASAILSIPSTIRLFVGEPTGFWKGFFNAFSSTGWLYSVLYLLLIVVFAYFYMTIQYNPIEMANNLRTNNGTIPGIRPGRPTAEFISKILSKITLIGAIFLAVVAVLPIVLGNLTGMSIQLGGTSLLIVVGVALDTTRSLDSFMTMRSHKGFLG